MAASTKDKAETPAPKDALSLLIEAAPKNETFSIELREGVALNFRMLKTHGDFARWNAEALEKAKKVAPVLFKVKPDTEIGPDDLATVVQCCKMADVALDEGTTVSRLFEFSQTWGLMFEGLWSQVSAKLLVGEVQAVNKEIDNSKNA